jgi:hypothetical protein
MEGPDDRILQLFEQLAENGRDPQILVELERELRNISPDQLIILLAQVIRLKGDDLFTQGIVMALGRISTGL